MLKNIKVPENYIELDSEVRKDICRIILQETIRKIKFKTEVKDIYTYIEKIIKATELDFAKKQEYEAAQLFADLNTVLNEEIRSNDAV